MVDCKERTETANLSTALLAHSVANSYKYDCFHIDDLLLEDTKGKKQMLSDVLQENSTPKIVFFFSYLNCESCIASIFSSLKDCCSEMDNDAVVIIGEFANRRAVDVYLGSSDIPFRVYYKNESQPIEILEKEGAPFVCIMKPDMVARNLMFPVKEVPLYLNLYIEAMKSKYFNKTVVAP